MGVNVKSLLKLNRGGWRGDVGSFLGDRLGFLVEDFFFRHGLLGASLTAGADVVVEDELLGGPGRSSLMLLFSSKTKMSSKGVWRRLNLGPISKDL